MHRGAGYKSRRATAAYEAARESAHRFAHRRPRARRRGRLGAQHHRGHQPPGLPACVWAPTTWWSPRSSSITPTCCLGPGGPAALGGVRSRRHLQHVDDVVAVLDDGPAPALLAMTGASNVTGWLPPVEEICAAAHAAGHPRAARCGPAGPAPSPPAVARLHRLQRPQALRPLRAGRADRPRADLRRTAIRSWPAAARWTWSTWTRSSGPSRPSARRRARPTSSARWPSARPWTSSSASAGTTIEAHEHALVRQLHDGSARHRRCARARARGRDRHLAVATFAWTGMHHALVAARLSAEWGIGVRHGCFCAHPYLIRLLGVGQAGWTKPERPCTEATAAGFPVRCGPVAAWAPRATTSTRCSRPSRALADGRPPRCPTCRTA